tara:strand:+ start:1291 stop:1572 length:282 start_codon:yes stop_codon:yes gene_type:complete
MAPMVSGSKLKEDNSIFSNKKLLSKKNELLQIRNYIEKNFEFVGDKFSQKVREVYYDKNTRKTIYGTATKEEREELSEEGIDLLSIPWVSKDN